MYIINITEAKARFSEVVNQVLAGEEVIIERMGKPVARISRYEPVKEQKRLGLMAGEATIPDNFSEWPEEEASKIGIVEPSSNASKE